MALDAFAELGLDGVSVRDLARRSQVSTSALFHHFPTKEQLYAAAYEHAVGLAYSHYREVVVGSAGLVDELNRILNAADALLAERPAIALLAVRAQIDQQRPNLHLSHRPATADTFREELVRRAIERGELAPDDAVHVQRLLDVVLWGISVIGYEDAELRRQVIDAVAQLVARAFPDRADMAAED